jgi:hypothetical protein
MQRRAGLAAGQAASAVPFSCPRAERNRLFVGRWRRHIQRRRLLPSPMNQYTPTGSEFPRARSASLTRRLAGPSPGPRSRGGAESRHARLVCIECGAVAGEEAEGWRAYLGWRHPSAERRRRWISSSVQSRRPVVPRGAPVADAVLEDPPRVAQIAPVLPDRVPDLEVVVRPLLVHAERLPARPWRRLPALRHSVTGSAEGGTAAPEGARPYRPTAERPRSGSGRDRPDAPSGTARRCCSPPQACRSAPRRRRS